jgi:hypothetical protein
MIFLPNNQKEKTPCLDFRDIGPQKKFVVIYKKQLMKHAGQPFK